MTANDRALALCDILLGAAHADDHFHERETAFVRAHMVAICGGERPRELADRIDAFDPARFDLERTAAAFAGDSEDHKRDLLELVAALHSTDEELDLAEDDYLRAVARAIEAGEGALDGLALDYREEGLQNSFERLRSVTPPPPPER